MSRKRHTTSSANRLAKPAVQLPDLSSDELEAVQLQHLRFLESWSSDFPKLCGVDISRVFTYELIQVLNNEYLKGRGS